jgi:hypothetical protein
VRPLEGFVVVRLHLFLEPLVHPVGFLGMSYTDSYSVTSQYISPDLAANVIRTREQNHRDEWTLGLVSVPDHPSVRGDAQELTHSLSSFVGELRTGEQ